MRVLHLIKSLGRGGAENLLLAAARHRSGGPFEYSFAYFLPWKDELVVPLGEAGAEVHCFSARSPVSILARVPLVARHLRRQEIDLVHCHLPLAGVAGRLAGRLVGVPVVYTEHNLMERYHPLTRKVNVWTWRLQRSVVAVSQEVARSIARHTGPAIPVEVVTNGIPVHRMQPDPEAGARVREELGIPRNAPVIGHLAVFRRQKRLDLWLQAAAAVRRRYPEARFLLVGDGPLRDEVKSLGGSLGLDPALHLPGLQENVIPYLSAMDLLMISSEYEGLPLVLLEAMAMGVPVVATTVGGVPEAVSEGVTGRLVPPGESADLAEAVGDLLADAETRRAMGEAARERVVERFSTDQMLDRLEDLYRKVVDGERPR